MTVTVEVELPEAALEVIDWLDDSFGETREEKLQAFVQFGLFNIPDRCFDPPRERVEMEEDATAVVETADDTGEEQGDSEAMDPMADGVEWLFDGDKPRKLAISSDVGPFTVTMTANGEGESATIKVEPPRSVNVFDADLHERAAQLVHDAVEGTDARIKGAVGGADHAFLVAELNREARPGLVLPDGWTKVESD